MKRVALLCAFCAVCTVFAEEETGTRSRTGFAFSYAGALTPSEFKDYWGTGYIFTLTEDVEPLDPADPFGAMLNIDVGFFPFNEDKFYDKLGRPSGASIDVSSLILVNVDIMLKYYFLQMGRIPYITAGLGFSGLIGGDATVYYNGSPIGRVEGVDNEALTFSAGIGFDIPLGGNTKMFVDARYCGMAGFGGYNAYYPIRVGLVLPISLIMTEEKK